MRAPDGLTGTHDLAQETAATFRQLDYWRHRGWVLPSHTLIPGNAGRTTIEPWPLDGAGSGRVALYDTDAADNAHRFAVLVHAGITPWMCARVLNVLAGTEPDPDETAVMTTAGALILAAYDPHENEGITS